MKNLDKIEVVELLIKVVNRSKVIYDGLVTIDAEKMVETLNVELCLLEVEEERLMNEANQILNDAAELQRTQGGF